MTPVRLLCSTMMVAAWGLAPPVSLRAQVFDPLGPRATTSRQTEAYHQLYPIESAGLWGFIDAEGKVAIEPQFDAKGQFHAGFAVVTRDGEHGYVSHRGKFMGMAHYERLFPFAGDFARVTVAGSGGRGGSRRARFLFIDRTGRGLSATTYDNAGDFSEGLARVYLAAGAAFEGRFIADSWGYVNPRGEMMIRPQFKEAGDFHEGLARVSSLGRWGYIDDDGDVVIEPRFDFAEDFSQGLAVVQIGGQRGYINKKGEQVIAAQFEYAGPFRSERAAVARSAAQQFEFINPRGRVVIDRKFEAAGDFSQGLARVYEAGRWGYINTVGEPVIPPQFDDAHDFNGDLALVTVGSAWGYVNRDGQFVWRSDGPLTADAAP